MATALTKRQKDTLASVKDASLEKTKTRRIRTAKGFLEKGWSFTLARMATGALMVLEYQNLRSAYIGVTGSDKDVPTDALTATVLAAWEELGVKGYSWDAVADWDKANIAYTGCSPEFQKELGVYGAVTITTLKDAAQIPPAASENKKGQPVPPREDVLRSVVASGKATDKDQRDIVKMARNGGTLPSKTKATKAQQSTAIQNAGKDHFPAFLALLPDPNEDGDYTVPLGVLHAVALWGVQLRDVAGSKDVLAYQDAIAEKCSPPDPEAEAASAAAEAALATAIAEREAAEAALAATEAS